LSFKTSHVDAEPVDHVIEVARNVVERAPQLRGYRITWQPSSLRHFTAQFEQLAL
jgi:tryptophanase